MTVFVSGGDLRRKSMNIVPIKIDLLDFMGTDLDVVNAARESFDKESSELSERDIKLIKYLAAYNHWTPFAHCVVKFRVKVPMFLARQLDKHQIGLVKSEMSRRYIDTEPEVYIPEVLRNRPDKSIKQGSGEPHRASTPLLNVLVKPSTSECLNTYRALLEQGVAPEEARMVFPMNTMTEWIWTGSLAAWARVYNLRIDPNAQKLAQEFAGLLGEHMLRLYPHSWKALTCNKV